MVDRHDQFTNFGTVRHGQDSDVSVHADVRHAAGQQVLVHRADVGYGSPSFLGANPNQHFNTY